jgi:hypothetical protein
LDQQIGLTTLVNQGTLAPSTTLGVSRPNSITLSGQRLFLRKSANGFLTIQISPANFDEVYRINFFEARALQFRTARCESATTENGGNFTLTFEESTRTVDKVLGSINRLFTLRGTAGGSTEPNSGTLIGSQYSSSNPLPRGLTAVEDPRFSGVLNLLDVSGNQIRTDATFVFDQIDGALTQSALLDIGSSRPPFITGSLQPAGQTCPNRPGSVCGRFQFNQPFSATAASDVLVISGTFTGEY